MLTLLLLACPSPEKPVAGDDCAAGSGTICTWAGTGLAGLGIEGARADETFFYLPQDLSFGPDGNAYVLDWNNHRVREILTSDRTIHTVAGTGELGDGPEGPADLAKFNHPTNVTFGPDGRMYIAAWHNSRVVAVDLAANTLSFICGDGSRSFGGDGGLCVASQLNLPSAVAFDADGNMYISDMANQRIRRMTPDQIVDSWGFDGTPGYIGDGGPIGEAEMHATVGQAADPANRIVIDDQILYLADTENHCIRAVDLETGIINTIAGSGNPGYGGDGGPALNASLRAPRDIAIGPDGALYIADTDNSCVRRVLDDTIETVAGQCAAPGYDGDGADATAAHLYEPYGIALDAEGNLYIADTYNNVIRKVQH